MFPALYRVIRNTLAPAAGEDFCEEPQPHQDQPGRDDLRPEIRTDSGIAAGFGQTEGDEARDDSQRQDSQRQHQLDPAAARGWKHRYLARPSESRMPRIRLVSSSRNVLNASPLR